MTIDSRGGVRVDNEVSIRDCQPPSTPTSLGTEPATIEANTQAENQHSVQTEEPQLAWTKENQPAQTDPSGSTPAAGGVSTSERWPPIGSLSQGCYFNSSGRLHVGCWDDCP